MRLTTMLRVVTAALVCAIAFNAAAQVAVPQLNARVTDLTGTLPAQSVTQLEQRLATFEREKGTQIAVLLVPTVKPESIEQYAVRVFEQWRLGRKGIDDGALLVVAKNDRVLRIEVGYGLEGVLTDATSNRIINDDIVPHFKRGDFTAGIEAGVARIVRVAGGEPLPAPAATRSGRSSGLPFAPEWLIAIFVFLQVINRVLRAMLGRVLAAGILATLTSGFAWIMFGSVIAAVIGGVVVFIATIGDSTGRGVGGRRGGWSSGGGSWSSGSGGGGFSGGGGSSGGGGASGRW